MADFEIVRLMENSWKEAQDLRVRAVQDEPRAFGQTVAEAEAVTEEEWRERFREGIYLFVQSDRRNLGFGYLAPEKFEKSKHVAWISNVYIDQEFRGKGAGRALIEALIKLGKETYPHIVKIILYASTTQPAAVALYESLGFSKEGFLEKEMLVDGDFVDSWVMTKFL